MGAEEAKSKFFRVVGGHDIQFCPYCGETLAEAVDHEVFEEERNSVNILTSNCPEKAEKPTDQCTFCPRCGENITIENQKERTKHKIAMAEDSTNRLVPSITCPFESAPFEVFLSQTKEKNEKKDKSCSRLV
jgi:hypothetical protein